MLFRQADTAYNAAGLDGAVNARRKALALQQRASSQAADAAATLRACNAAAYFLNRRPDAHMAIFSAEEQMAWADLILFVSDDDLEMSQQPSSSPRAAMDYRTTLRLPPGAPITSEVTSRAVRARRLDTHPDTQTWARQATRGRVPLPAGQAARRFRHVQAAAATAADDRLRMAADAALLALIRRRTAEEAARAAALGAAATRARSPPTVDWVTIGPAPEKTVSIGGVRMRAGSAPSRMNACCLDSVLQILGRLSLAGGTMQGRRDIGVALIHELARDASALLRSNGPAVIGALIRSYIDTRLGGPDAAYFDYKSMGAEQQALVLADHQNELAYQLGNWGAASASDFRGMTSNVGIMALSLHLECTIVVVDASPRRADSQRSIVDVYGQWLGNDIHLLKCGDHYVPLFRAPTRGRRPRNAPTTVPRWDGGDAAAASSASAAASAAAAAAEEQLRRSAGEAARAAAATASRPGGSGSGSGPPADGPNPSDRQRQAHQRQHNANVRRDRGICCDVCHGFTSVRGSEKGLILKCSGPGAGQDGYCTGARHANCRHEDQAAHPAYPGEGPFYCSIACHVAREADPRDDFDDDSAGSESAGSAGGPRRPVRGPSGGPPSRPPGPRPPRVAHNDRQHIDEGLLVALRLVNLDDTFRGGLPPLLLDIPSSSRRQLCSLWAEACSLIEENVVDDGPFKLLELFAYLLLVTPSPAESKGGRIHAIVNRRFKRLTVQHDVAGLLKYAADRRKAVIDERLKNTIAKQNQSPEDAAAEADDARIKRADHLASEGFVSRSLRVLSHQALPPADVALSKLTQLNRPAGAPISEAFRQFAPPRPAFSIDSPMDEKELAEGLLEALAGCKSAAGGPNGITGRHLRGMLLDSDNALLGTLRVLDRFANATVPECIESSQRMSLLIALRKPSSADNGPGAIAADPSTSEPPPAVGIRPIAMGQLMRRLTGKMLLRLHHDKYCSSVGAAQLGLEKCAAEVGYHAVTLKLQSTEGPKCILLWDIEHAFGSAERTHGLEEMTRCVPEAVPFVRSVYGGPAGELLYTEPTTGTVHSFFSRQGFDQGCPQAGPLFCLAYKPALDDVCSTFPDVLTTAYYDDSPMAGTTMRVAAAYNYMLREGGPLQKANMRHHPEKTCVWSPTPLTEDERAAFPVGTRFEAPDSGIIMWGCPIGSDEFIRRALDDAVLERFTPAMDGGSLEKLYAQNSMSCMRMGVNARFDNLLRVVSPRILAAAAAAWDDNVLGYVERFVCSGLPRDAQIKLTQPLRDGGLGLRSKTQLMHVAFLSAWLASRSLIWERFPSLRSALRDTSEVAATPLGPQAMEVADANRSSASAGVLASDLRDAYSNVISNANNNTLLVKLLGSRGLGAFTAPDVCPEDFASLQKRMSTNVHTAIKDTLLEQTDRRGRALILSTSGTGASAWLTAQRGWGPDFVLPNQHMRAAVAFRLGLDLPQLVDAGLVGELCPLLQCSKVNAEGQRVYLDPDERHEACTGTCDAKGDHLLGCKFGHQGRIGRHNNIVGTLARITLASFPHKVHVITDQTLLRQHMRRFDQPGVPPSNHHIPDLRVIYHTLGYDDDIVDAVVTGFNQVAASGSVTGASALKIQQDKYKQYTSAVLSRPAPVTTSQLIAFAMDSAGYIAPHGNAMLKKLGERKAATTCDGVTDSSLSRKSQTQRAAIYRQHMTQAISVTLMRSQMHVILQAAYNGHQRNGTPCVNVPTWARPQFFDASWAAAYNATSFC